EGVGHPAQYGTTRLFLERLGLESLEKLPALAELVPDPGVMDELEARLAEATRPGVRFEPVRRRRSAPARPGEGQASLGDVDPAGVRPGLVYYLLNKPAKVVTTAHDPEGRPTVIDLVPAEPRVFPVGRLDWDTEGLLLLTNDGDLAHGLTHPSRGVPKTYLAEVTGIPGRAALRRLREGVDLDDGRTAPARATLAQTTPTGAALEVVIHEGRNRPVRRMCEA